MGTVACLMFGIGYLLVDSASKHSDLYSYHFCDVIISFVIVFVTVIIPIVIIDFICGFVYFVYSLC